MKEETAVEQPNYDTETWVDDRALASRTSISRATWQSWRSRREGPPFYRAGKRCLYKLSEVLAWLETKRVEPKKAS